MLRPHTTKGAITMVMAIALVTATSGWVLAGHGSTEVTSYTGCVSNGTLVKLTQGDLPTPRCTDLEQQVHLSGGDITSLTPTGGLTGGGQQGALSLGVDTAKIQTRVTGTCPTGRAVRSISQLGAVSCGAGPSAYQRGPGPGGIIETDVQKQLGNPLFLVKGQYWVLANLNIRAHEANGQRVQATCNLQQDEGGLIDVLARSGFASPDNPGVTPEGSVTLTSLVSTNTTSAFSVHCRNFSSYDELEWRDLSITAVQLDSVAMFG